MILNYGKDNGFTSFISSFSNLKKILPDISEEVKRLFNNLDSDSNFNVLLEDFFNKDSFNDTIFKNWIEGLNETEIASMTAGEALEKYKSHLSEIGKQTTIFAKLGSALKSIGGTLLSAFANMAIIWTVSKGIELAYNAIDNYIHRVEIAIEKGEEAKQVMKKVQYQELRKITFNTVLF